MKAPIMRVAQVVLAGGEFTLGLRRGAAGEVVVVAEIVQEGVRYTGMQRCTAATLRQTTASVALVLTGAAKLVVRECLKVLDSQPVKGAPP
jgi:hypothetical protein